MSDPTESDRARWISQEFAAGVTTGKAWRLSAHISRLKAQLAEVVKLMERVRPILCGLAIEVEQKQKVEGSHYLTDAVAVKDEVVAFLASRSASKESHE